MRSSDSPSFCKTSLSFRVELDLELLGFGEKLFETWGVLKRGLLGEEMGVVGRIEWSLVELRAIGLVDGPEATVDELGLGFSEKSVDFKPKGKVS